MRLKLVIDFEDSGDEHSVAQGLDYTVDVKEGLTFEQRQEAFERFLNSARELYRGR